MEESSDVVTATTYRRKYGSGHSYTLDGVPKIKGVTTMLRGLPKDLEKYFTEYTAGYALDHWDELAQLPPAERFKKMAGATKERFKAAGAKGTAVHRLAERLVAGEEVEVPDHLRGYVEACVQFMDDYDLKADFIEPALFSRRYKYAGAADLFGTAVKPMTSKRIRVLIDYKSGSSEPWGSVAFQFSGYRYADFMLSGDGGKDSTEMPVPEVDECWAVHLRQDGYDVYPMDTSPEILNQLRHIDQCRLADEECRYYKHDALPHPETVRKVRLADVPAPRSAVAAEDQAFEHGSPADEAGAFAAGDGRAL